MGKREDGQRSPDEWGDDSFWWGVSWFDKAVVPAVTFRPAEGHSLLCSSLSVGLINFSENCLTAYTEISPGLVLYLASSLSTLLILSFHTGPCRQAAPDPGEDGVKQTGPRRVYKAPRATDKRAWGGKRTDKARERAREGTENSSQTGIGSSGIACFSEREQSVEDAVQNTDTAVPSAKCMETCCCRDLLGFWAISWGHSWSQVHHQPFWLFLFKCLHSHWLCCHLLAEPARLFRLVVLETLLCYCLQPRVCVLACISVTWL